MVRILFIVRNQLETKRYLETIRDWSLKDQWERATLHPPRLLNHVLDIRFIPVNSRDPSHGIHADLIIDLSDGAAGEDLKNALLPCLINDWVPKKKREKEV